MAPKTKYDTIFELSRRRGFFWPSYEIYGGLGGFIDYGDLGVKLRRKIDELWREFFVRRQGFLELDSPLINPERVFEASGHLRNFKEYSVTCKRCSASFRVDHLLEEKTGLENVEALGGEAMLKMWAEAGIACPRCGGELGEPELFLTMFKTEIGSRGGEVGYLRPETAQSMFINFKRGYLYARERLPFALAQSSKVARNEISPRRGLLRLREFTINELELFFDPLNPGCRWFPEVADLEVKLITEEMEGEGVEEPLAVSLGRAVEEGLILTQWQAYFMGVSQRFISALGVPPEKQRFRAHLPEERAHYSAQTYDHEVLLDSWGWVEVSGCAYRTDFDLRSHQEASGQSMEVLREDGSRFIPHVVEPSYGLDRLVYVAMEYAYERREKRNILRFPREIAPYQAVVLPLVSKDGVDEKAAKVWEGLVEGGFWVLYDAKGSVGRRYARADEIGVPLAVTVDYKTLEDETVTLRDRDTWAQVRVGLGRLHQALTDYYHRGLDFSALGEPVD